MASRPTGRRMDPAQESLIGALHTGFAVLRILMIVLLVAYAASGSLRVDAGEQGLIVRLGQLLKNADTGTAVFGQGWRWALPDPFDEKIRLPGRTATLVIDTFAFQRLPGDMMKPLSAVEVYKDSLQPGFDGAMLTGDKNLAHGVWKVEYRIENAEQYVRSVGESLEAVQPLLQRLTETAVIREVGGRRFDDVTRGDVAAVAGAVRDRLRTDIQPLELGVEIVGVVADTVEPPSVRGAYRAVSDAENQKRAVEDDARREAAQRLNEAAGPGYAELLQKIRMYGGKLAAQADERELATARAEIDAMLEQAGGQVATTLKAAKAQADETDATLEAEHNQYKEWLQQYRMYPRLARMELWNLMRRFVISSAHEVFYVPQTDRVEILINRDPDIRLQREVEALQRGGGNR